MKFDLNDEQRELQMMVRRFAAEHLQERRESIIRGESGYDDTSWRRLAVDLGVVGLTIPEDRDGSGATAIEAVIALEELGRVCAPLPAASTMTAVEVLARTDTDAAGKTLAAVASGEARIGLPVDWAEVNPSVSASTSGDGPRVSGKLLVPHAAELTHLLLATPGNDRMALISLRTPEVTFAAVDTLDLSQPIGAIELAGAPYIALTSQRGDLASIAREFGALYLAADSLGIARWCLEVAVEWSKEREQFGRPIGANQALKHMCADALVEIETAAVLVYYAAFALDGGHDDAGVYVSLAKQQATDAADLAARQAIQILGGIGFTWEHHAHLYLRRAKANVALCGDRDHHLERVAEAICAPYELSAGVR
ncbi:acyl-CoA dehydrogenase family protein [Cumulibacter soli]|uniref:acyl-CoA dehydrogenase family protein n=1 Tax=Cumulibacter soli TaxID=2546344 RepID=UPI001419F716|nr:acyl-CoA dehydrogenase family protein [Cumulibacter soli]